MWENYEVRIQREDDEPVEFVLSMLIEAGSCTGAEINNKPVDVSLAIALADLLAAAE